MKITKKSDGTIWEDNIDELPSRKIIESFYHGKVKIECTNQGIICSIKEKDCSDQQLRYKSLKLANQFMKNNGFKEKYPNPRLITIKNLKLKIDMEDNEW